MSLNHNWLNSHNLRAVYDTLERDVAAARASIEDVRELLRTRARAGEDGRGEGWRWEVEFEGCVREMVGQNSGWESVGSCLVLRSSDGWPWRS